MALTKNTNSYVTLLEADAYFEDRLDVAAWDAATDTQKEQALIGATMMLDSKSWTGYAVSNTQPLAFPRIGTYFDPRVGTEVSLKETEVPSRIIQATYEQAYHLINNDGLLDGGSSVESIKVGSIELKDIRSTPKTPSVVKDLVKPLLVRGGSSTWWRAN